MRREGFELAVSRPRVVVKQGDDYVLKTVATIVENDQDKHVGKCPMK